MSRNSSASESSYSYYSDESSPTVSGAGEPVDPSQLEIVRQHLLKTNATFLAPKEPAAVAVTDSTQPKQSFFRRLNIFARTPSKIPEEDIVSVASSDQLTTLGTAELEALHLKEKQAYLDMRKLRDLPRNDRHLFWEQRSEYYSCYPLPTHPKWALQQDDEAASYSSQSSTSASNTDSHSHTHSYSTSQHSHISALTPVLHLKLKQEGISIRTTMKRQGVALDKEAVIIQYIQAEKRKRFLENCILSAHGVKVLPSYLKRPATLPEIRSIEEQCEEDARNRKDDKESPNQGYLYSPQRRIQFDLPALDGDGTIQPKATSSATKPRRSSICISSLKKSNINKLAKIGCEPETLSSTGKVYIESSDKVYRYPEDRTDKARQFAGIKCDSRPATTIGTATVKDIIDDTNVVDSLTEAILASDLSREQDMEAFDEEALLRSGHTNTLELYRQRAQIDPLLINTNNVRGPRNRNLWL